ncbi:protein CTLA-2-beta isoform X1 [Cimex lectularius]|uniref:Cathepsin propeptide inhibitor domain-containing protein n=1 Tax=Cimex lectularius TaxID=79782 RepID=A0A8I6RBB5_CIMLE|nr:protein CTLA-2-beta isoform X1 [Cimex lectularius]
MSEETWESWKVTYSKSYATPEEEAKRKEIWETTKKRVKEHNEKYEKGEVTFKMGVNQFADLLYCDILAMNGETRVNSWSASPTPTRRPVPT